MISTEINDIKADISEASNQIYFVKAYLKGDLSFKKNNYIFFKNLISIKYFKNSCQSPYGKYLLSDLLNSYASLLGTKERPFVFFLRSSIEDFYKFAILQENATSYYAAKESFTRLVSTTKGFSYTNNRKKLIKYYSDLSDVVHFNPDIEQDISEYLIKALSENQFEDRNLFLKSANDLFTLTDIYMEYFWYFPKFSPRDDSFYKHKEAEKFLENNKIYQT